MKVEWEKQHPGVHRATFEQLRKLMPQVYDLVLEDFPEHPKDFIWDVKVHMLMPGQFPCIPNWHYDNIPRLNNRQDFSKIRPDLPMYLWLSGGPLTEFRVKGLIHKVKPEKWIRFNQCSEHRGTVSDSFCWRGFIRATHKDIAPQNDSGNDPLRRHSQVYLDSNNFKW